MGARGSFPKKKKKTGSVSGLTQKPKSISPSRFKKKKKKKKKGKTIWAFLGFKLGFSKYKKKGLRYSLRPLSHTFLYALMLQFNICYYLNCLALIHVLEIKSFLLFEYKLFDTWT
jgi:hypothetical protein